ncbi:MAG: hypothetical protein KDD41_01250 [Flavobacteriales bacterium]|nr:hypothetical protein [Flavobacteriales bacterium]
MKSFIIVCFIGLSFPLFAQLDSLSVAPDNQQIFTDDNERLLEPKVTFDFDIRAAFTSGEFKTFYPKPGMGGMGLTVLFPLGKRFPLDLGVDLGYYFMSQSQETFNYYTPGLGDYDVESRVSGGMFTMHAVGRVYPFKTVKLPIQPYVEGLAGFRVFSANQKLETYVYATDEYLPVEKDYNYYGAWSYGFGAGVKVMLSKNELLYLNLKVDQIYGTATKNMDPSTVELYDDGTYTYSEFTSRTDILRFALGIHIMIE